MSKNLPWEFETCDGCKSRNPIGFRVEDGIWQQVTQGYWSDKVEEAFVGVDLGSEPSTTVMTLSYVNDSNSTLNFGLDPAELLAAIRSWSQKFPLTCDDLDHNLSSAIAELTLYLDPIPYKCPSCGKLRSQGGCDFYGPYFASMDFIPGFDSQQAHEYDLATCSREHICSGCHFMLIRTCERHQRPLTRSHTPVRLMPRRDIV